VQRSQACWPPSLTVRSGSALAGVRFHATTLCPAAANARTRALPILPVPNTATTVSFMLYSPKSSIQRPFSGGVDCGGLLACVACSKP
jgi:hypothetical protein